MRNVSYVKCMGGVSARHKLCRMQCGAEVMPVAINATAPLRKDLDMNVRAISEVSPVIREVNRAPSAQQLAN